MDFFADKKLDARSRIDWQPQTPPDLGDAPYVVVDTETTGLQWWKGDAPIGIGVAVLGGPAYYLPFGHRGGGNLSEGAVKDWAREQLKGKKIIGQNIKFDNHIIRSWGVDLEAMGCRLYDTTHLAALLDDNRKVFNLDALAKEMLGVEGKVKLTSFTNVEIDPSQMAEYHAGEIADYGKMDVQLTGALWQLMHPKIVEEDLDKVLDLESRLIYPVCEMERNPPQLDVYKLIEWIARSETELRNLLKQVGDAIGGEFNPTPTGWQKLFSALGVDPPSGRTKKKKDVSYTTEALKKIDNPIVQLGLQAAQLKSLRSKYLLAYEKGMDLDGRLRTNFHQLRADEGGTITGRFSSSAYHKPEKVGCNLQQVFAVAKQKENFGGDYIIRELFVPSNGLWFAADAEQIEYRIFAHYANSEKILKAYADDPSISYHKLVWDMVKPFKPDIPYKAVKNLNFAKIYGAGLDKLAEMLGLPRSESDPFVQVYNQELPEAGELLALASQTARRRGHVKTFLGRRGRFPKAQRLYKALNTIIQGTAADIMKEKTIQAYDHRKEFGLMIRMTVHDELDGDTPDDEMANRLKTLLNVQSFDLRIPILWSMKTGANWAACE